MRRDMVGFFWDDTPEEKVLKEKPPKRTPPERTWEREDYLPYLEEAQRFDVPLFTDDQLVSAWARNERLVFDIESYKNYFCIAFKSMQSGRVLYFERGNELEQPMDLHKLRWVVEHFTIVGFNSNSYDLPILSLALAGENAARMKIATNQIIQEDVRGWELVKQWDVKMVECDHIDLIELVPLHSSLKICAGRLHAPRMQDLPFPESAELSPQQQNIVRWYCVNDLNNTIVVYNQLEKQIQLRERMSEEYRVDLRSRSDAQVAEAVIARQVQNITHKRVQKRAVEPGRAFRYQVPEFLRFDSGLMNWALGTVAHADFIVSEHGNIGMPEQLKELQLQIANGIYRMGIGGLHSSEQSVAHLAGDEYVLCDRDVTSYYPSIILNQSLFPVQMGLEFLEVYQRIVDRRIEAKRSGNTVVADALKITINGSFGKFGNAFSTLYSPELLIQVTVTGQLALLMLIERLEMRGISVVSANTDGIVIKAHKTQVAEMHAVVAGWERDTRFGTEETSYAALYSRDVNSYIAVKPNGETKRKGAYAKTDLHKNPTGEISINAVLALLAKGVPIAETIKTCTDIRQFVSVRNVRGGAVKDGHYLGKSIRWYYAADEVGEIIYAASGNKVPKSDGARPIMDMPETLPPDIDYDRYVAEATGILIDIGYGVAT